MTERTELLEENRLLRIELDTLRADMFALSKGPIARSDAPQGLVKSDVIKEFFDFSDRTSFWNFVRAEGVPHIRITKQKIMFDPIAVNHWIARRSTASAPRQFLFGDEANQVSPVSAN